MRQLESLIRLTEARAKLELREEATEGDAIDVVEIMRASMVDTAADPSMGPNGSLVRDSHLIQISPPQIPKFSPHLHRPRFRAVTELLSKRQRRRDVREGGEKAVPRRAAEGG